MAHMYPLKPDADTSSYAEVALHEAFSRQLSDDYWVFHSVKWQNPNKQYGALDAEADFVLLHPAQGLLLVEVKGGSIEVDGESDTWTSNGVEIKNPIAQAQANKYHLRDRLAQLPAWRGGVPPIAYAIAFPDVVVRGEWGAAILPELLLDRSDLDQIARWTKRAFACAFGDLPSAPLDDASLARLVDFLRPTRTLRMGIGGEIREEDRRIAQLTADQFHLLRLLGKRRRVVVEGCAGSGKTMLAIEQARRLAKQGCRVLFVCFNQFLPAHLRTNPSLKGVDVFHFHGLCSEMTTRAHIVIPPKSDSDSDYFNVTLPGLLMDAIEVLGPQYDAIIVDEGQDMMADWWTYLEFLMPAEDGYFFVFLDRSQNLYAREMALPERMEHFTLNENCRNTRRIHAAMTAHLSDEVRPVSLGPDGRDPELLFYADDRELHKQIATVLHRLTHEENVPTEQIVILTQRKIDRTALKGRDQIGAWKLTQEWPPAANEIFANTIYQFKGMESPVVILAEVTKSRNQDLGTLWYVGCSRAKNHLIVLAPHDMEPVLKQQFSAV